MIEADDIVIAEGSVVARLADGTPLHLAMCDVFEMGEGKMPTRS